MFCTSVGFELTLPQVPMNFACVVIVNGSKRVNVIYFVKARSFLPLLRFQLQVLSHLLLMGRSLWQQWQQLLVLFLISLVPFARER